MTHDHGLAGWTGPPHICRVGAFHTEVMQCDRPLTATWFELKRKSDHSLVLDTQIDYLCRVQASWRQHCFAACAGTVSGNRRPKLKNDHGYQGFDDTGSAIAGGWL